MGQNTMDDIYHSHMDVMYGYIRREQSLCVSGHFDASLPVYCCLTPVFDG